MKFINYLTSITGVEIYPLISLGIFFLFFVALLVFVFKADKGYINALKSIPFNEDKTDNSTNTFNL